MIKFAEERTLTEDERQRLNHLMYLAFIDIRGLTVKSDRHQQAHDLADAFHNVPLQLFGDHFSIPAFLSFLSHYQQKYEGKLTIDYLKEWEKLNTTTP